MTPIEFIADGEQSAYPHDRTPRDFMIPRGSDGSGSGGGGSDSGSSTPTLSRMADFFGDGWVNYGAGAGGGIVSLDVPYP